MNSWDLNTNIQDFMSFQIKFATKTVKYLNKLLTVCNLIKFLWSPAAPSYNDRTAGSEPLRTAEPWQSFLRYGTSLELQGSGYNFLILEIMLSLTKPLDPCQSVAPGPHQGPLDPIPIKPIMLICFEHSNLHWARIQTNCKKWSNTKTFEGTLPRLQLGK